MPVDLPLSQFEPCILFWILSRMSVLAFNHRPTWVVVVLLTVFTAVLMLPGINTRTASRQQELRVLLCARDMVEGGDWVIPHFMGEERLRKPPLMYWLVAGAFKLVGSTESLGAARGVSALCAVALVISTFMFGRGILGRKAAFLGAMVLATSLGFLYHGRLAETDLPQTLFCSLAVMFLYEAIVLRRFRGWIFAGLAVGLGFMIKGPASVAMPMAAVLSYLLLTRLKFSSQASAIQQPRKSALYFLWGALVTLLIAGLIAAPWYYAVALRTAATGDQASDEISRLLTESAHRGSIFFYFYTLPARMGVWGLALPVAVYAAWKHLRHHCGARWLLCWLASSFAILSLLSSKQNHYALLLFVPAALLIGWLFDRAVSRINLEPTPETDAEERSLPSFYGRFADGYLKFLFGVAGLIGLVGLIAWVGQIQMAWPWPMAIVCLLMLCLSFLVLRCSKSRPITPSASVMVLASIIALVGGLYQTCLEKSLEGDCVVESLIMEHRAEISRSPHIAILGDHSAMVEWYAHHRSVKSFSLQKGAFKNLHPGDVLIATARKKHLQLNPNDPPPNAKRVHQDVEAALYVR
jgi:4-amino-4-deoxy-L-arabinose transferase-like glycosyltransferase